MSSTSSKKSHDDPSPAPRRPPRGHGKNTEHLAVLEALNLPVSLVTPQYTYKWVNSCFGAALGKHPEEIIGRKVRDLWGETFDKAIKGRLDRCFRGMEVRSKAWITYPAHGRRYCEIVHVPYCPDGESVVSAIVIAYDTTDRKEMEERLSQSEQRFRNLSEASLEAIVFIEDGVIVDANSALSQLFGYEGHELRGKQPTDFIAPERRALADQRIQARTEGVYETVGIRRDGSLFPVEINSREFQTNGRSLRIAAIRDLTERKEMERKLKAHEEHLERLVEERTEELRKREEKLRNIFEHATEGIFQIAQDGSCLSINPAFARIHGYATPEDFIAEVTDIEQVHVEPEQRRAYIALLYREGRIRNFEFKVYRRDKSVAWVSVNSRAVRDATGAVLYHEGTVQDISQRKQAEEDILLQHDLALKLAGTSSLEKALLLCLVTALKVAHMESGGIYVRDRQTGDLHLACASGLSKQFEDRIPLVRAGSAAHALVMAGKPHYLSPHKEAADPFRKVNLEEGFISLAVLPVLHDRDFNACFILASRTLDTLPLPARATLELIALQLGAILTRIQAEQDLQKDIEKRKRAEEALEAKSQSLEEANTALKVLLKHRDEDKKELEEKVASNMKQLVLPYVEKLKQGKLEPSQQIAADFVEANLKQILSPFLNNLRSFNFTPRQLETVALLKEGRTTKEIAALLQVSKEAIDMQRFLIRKKLGLNKGKANLRSYLLSLS